MKKQTLLNIMLTTVIVVLLFYIKSTAGRHENMAIDPALLGGTCRYDQINGFAAGKSVTRAEARTQATAFQTYATNQGNTILGGVISKTALDSLFCSGNYNGLAYKLAMDPTGKNGPANAIFVIVGGVNVATVNGKLEIASQSSSFYTNNLWCPPSCLSFE
jgi:hypothetical protein